jgi:hypothetical protein
MTTRYAIPGKSLGQTLEGWAINASVNKMPALPLSINRAAACFEGYSMLYDRAR